MRLPYFHEMGTETGRRCAALQRGFTRYKQREIERRKFCGLQATPSRLLRGFHPRFLEGDIGAQEIGHSHNPDQGAIVVQHWETAYFVIEKQLPRIGECGLASHRRHVGAHNGLCRKVAFSR